MGFFENLGRKVGKFTQEASAAAAEEATHVCRSCGERFYTDREDCPECGGDVVERETESPDEADVGGSETDSTGDGNESEVDSADESEA